MASAGPLYRIGVSDNLEQGGKYDLLLTSFSAGYPAGAVSFNLTETPRKISGIQKVAQAFLTTLLTTKGSDVLRPDRGTNFPTIAVNANRTGTNASIEAELIDQIADAEAQVKYMLNTSGSDVSSQLNRVQVLALDVGEESITMFLYLITNAGERAQVAIPFPQLNMALAE